MVYAFPALAQESLSYRIYGVIEAHNQPAVRASLILQFKHARQMFFAITDSTGKFGFTGTLPAPDTALCIARLLGYAADTSQIIINQSGSYLVNFNLRPKPYPLPEVVIQLPAENLDTLRFDIRTYLGQRDFYITDLINRIPGLSTDASGKIYYNNKPIKALLINGDPFLGDAYQQLTPNIRATTFDTVELIKDYHPNRLEKGLSLSQDVAVNLVTHRPFSGSASITGGTSLFNKYEAELNAFALYKPIKWFTYGKINNAGVHYEAFDNTSQTANPMAPQQLEPQWLIKPIPAGQPDVPYPRYAYDNRDQLAGSQLSLQLTPAHELTIHYTAGKQSQWIAQRDSSFFIVPGQQSWALTNQRQFKAAQTLQDLSLQWTYDPKKHYIATYAWNLHHSQPRHEAVQLTSGYLHDTLTEWITDKQHLWSARTTQQLRLGKHLLEADLAYVETQLPEQQLLHTSRLGKILDTSGKTTDYLQLLQSHFHSTFLQFGWTHGNTRHSYQAKAFYQSDALQQAHQIQAELPPDSSFVQNTYPVNLQEAGGSFVFQRNWNLFTQLKIGASLSSARSRYADQLQSFTLKQFSLTYQWSRPSGRRSKNLYVDQITLSLSHREHLLSADMLFPPILLSAGYQIKQPADRMYRTADNQGTTYFSIKMKKPDISFGPSFSVSYTPQPVIWSFFENPAYSFTQPHQGKNSRRYLLSGNFAKPLIAINSKCFYTLQYTVQDQPYLLNDVNYRQQLRVFSHTFTYQWSPLLWFLMEASYTQQQLHTQLRATRQAASFAQQSTIQKAYLKTSVDVTSLLKGNIVYNYIHTAFLPAFHTLDLFVEYRPWKNITVSLYGHNLLNHATLAYQTLDANSGQWTYYALVSRYLLFSVKWGL
ncbi:hypothetical protein SAMN05660895_1036 [Thermoflavifilum thermophilum]|uniref:Uncharacterized protein n=2 Tax=Thermoflavifilum thermophilum TaxID=1393122 RepID=A0A1I7N9Q0_9BACT|nr:hypothetical protein SAMN05660895_1036 [Thermoflavifilum thermophilum]